MTIPISTSTTDNGFTPPEPLRLKLYGFWWMSFPTWVVMQIGSFVLLGLLLIGAWELLHPNTYLGGQIHDMLKAEPYALEILSWAPPALLFIGVLELCETVVTLFLFRRQWRRLSSKSTTAE